MFILRGLQRLRRQTQLVANVEEHPLVFSAIQCISKNVRSCVFTGSAWPLIFIQLSSTPTTHFSLCNCGPCSVESHWLHPAVSPGMCNITFLFTSAAAGRARLQINTDILQWCWISSCLICIHNTTVGTIKGSSLVRQISIRSYMAANGIYSFVLGKHFWYTRWHLHYSEQGNIKNGSFANEFIWAESLV